jgi:hypothetical protein
MSPWRLLPQERRSRIAIAVVATLIMMFPASYLFLLAEERYSVWQASKMLDALEAIRLGDPAGKFEQAVRGCEIERANANYRCTMTAGAWRFGPLWMLMSKLPNGPSYEFGQLLNRTGLRYWSLSASSTVQDERIQSVSVHSFVAGSSEVLGASWAITEQVPAHHYGLRVWSADQERTYMGWYHITSVPSGEGFTVHATPASTENELRARHINRSCLFSSRGCDGLCELLPDVVPVLKERGSSWGGGTSATPAKCDLR